MVWTEGKRESKRRIQKYSSGELFYPQEGKQDLIDRFTSQDKIKMKGGKSNKASSPRVYNPTPALTGIGCVHSGQDLGLFSAPASGLVWASPAGTPRVCLGSTLNLRT